ncbi:MAG TPA: GNAT family N-acetyltransferase [Ktedonosporobacter sp.]|nr:GNAT family N-acetyltransferase [Ktedonosporobacter sp.]
MTTLSDRPYIAENDLELVTDLLLTYRAAGHVSRYPTVCRLQLLLSSRLWEPERDAHAWEDSDGKLVGFAFLARRQRENVGSGMDLIIHPDLLNSLLPYEMLNWVEQRARERANECQLALPISVSTGSEEIWLVTTLTQHAFTLVDGHNLYMACPLDRPFPEPVLPAGFSIRTLKDEDDLEEYEQLFGFATVNRQHRLELWASPEYCHLVVVAPDGTFVAYYECSINKEEWARSGQRSGWVDYIGTHSDYQKRGLGKALLIAGHQQLQQWGIDTARLVTMDTNTTAQSVFKAAGFTPAERDYVYQKIISPLSTTCA